MEIPPRRPSASLHFRALLVSSLAAVASFACGGEANSASPGDSTLGSAGGASAPPAEPASPAAPGCPAELPEPGSSCMGYAAWLSCEYDYCSGRKARLFCNPLLEAWDPPTLSCDPVPPLAAGCPASLPVAGSDCEPYGLSCDYRSECLGVPKDTAECRFGQWWIDYADAVTCDPLPFPPACPLRPIVAGAGCAFEGQACAPTSCVPGALYREGKLCLNGVWQSAEVRCSVGMDDSSSF